MKKYFFNIAIYVFIVFNLSCSYDKDRPHDDNGEDLVAVKVIESKTNIPLQGVKVSTFFCRKYDFEFGRCINAALFSSCMTKDNGICNCGFPEDNFHKITFEKLNYWPRYYSENKNEYIIQPEAWVNITLITTNVYPTTSHLFITVNGERGYQMNYAPAVNNSITILTLFGIEENSIDWVLYETPNTSSNILNSGVFTLKPGKFENLSYTLTY